MRVPMFANAQVNMQFNDIKVNELNQVYGGELVSVFNEHSEFLVEYGTDYGVEDDIAENDVAEGDVISPDVVVDDDINSVYVNDAREIIVVNTDGEEEVVDTDDLPEGDDVVIEDEHGEQWVVDEGGRVSNGGSDDSSSTPDTVASQDSIDFIVEFVASENQTYGFDAKRDNVGQYETVDIGGEQYAVPWKSVETGRLDATLATTEKSAFPESVGFKSINGELPSRPASGADQKQLSVTGRVNDTVEGITAYVIVEEDEGRRRSAGGQTECGLL